MRGRFSESKMPKCALIVLILCKIVLVVKCDEEEQQGGMAEADNGNYYVAAVMESHPPGNEFRDPQQIVDANLEEYVKRIYEAKERGVDILVFSEAALNYHGISSREDLIKFAIEVPEETSDENQGCDYTSSSILNELSEAVANASVYVLVNIVERCNESDVVSLFNANIVFDRSGCIVSRYRKFNLFVEPNMLAPEEPEMSVFDTDFGVTFGHFICFDILFKSPAYDMLTNLNVSHILYPSMWYSEMPFLTSTQIQQSYAYRNDIVLLSSGTNSPSNSNTGSGIFVGKHGAIESIISYRNESKMIVARVPKDVHDAGYRPVKSTHEPYPPSEMDALKLWTHPPAATTLTYALAEGSTIHEDGLECEFSIDFTRLPDEEEGDGGSGSRYGYRLIVFNGVRNYANTSNGGEIYCAIIACLNESDPTTCGQRFESSERLVPSVLFHSIKIKAILSDGSGNSHLIMPTSLDFSIKPLPVDDFQFTIKEDDGAVRAYEIESTNEQNEILTFGIYGRNFDRDGKHGAVEEEEEEEKSEPDNVETAESTSSIDEEENLEFIEVEEVHKVKENVRGHGDPNMFLTVAIYVPLMIALCIIAAILVYRRLQEPYEHPLIVMRRKSEMPQLA